LDEKYLFSPGSGVWASRSTPKKNKTKQQQQQQQQQQQHTQLLTQPSCCEQLFNARNIKGENTGQNTNMEYTSPITALSEMTGKIVSIRKYHHQQPPQTVDLVAMATCYCS
jgi:hypothetical protein